MTAWIEANRRFLVASIAVLRETLLAGGPDAPGVAAANESLTAARDALEDEPSALLRLAQALSLSPFERDVVLLAAGLELDPGLREVVEAAGGGPATLGQALASLEGAHWDAMTPGAPLRRYRLIELDGGVSVAVARLRIDERVLHYLLGIVTTDVRLAGLIEPVAIDGATDVVGSHAELVRRIAMIWNRHRSIESMPIIQVCGPDAASKLPLIAAACAHVGLGLHVVRASDLPTSPGEREALARLWEREALLTGAILMVECDDSDPIEAARSVAAMVERTLAPIVVAAREPLRFRRRLAIRVDVGRPLPAEQAQLWRSYLDTLASDLGGQLDRVVSQFSMGGPSIRAAAAEVLERVVDGDATPVERLIWDTCRTQARPKLDDLAQRIEPSAGWVDIVLPDDQLAMLRGIAAHVRQRAKVYGDWGFETKGSRGLGITALFAGASGTGKTLAAEVIAGDLGLDLYRIDLSQVVSKYIGETEKNLRRIFDAAEEGGAVLLFDEADALFGKRSEVKDSHDRYANLEVSYLLQRMEQYRGLAILTTNMRSALDTAFLRRLRFVIEFPFPGTEHRAEIWRRVFPVETPTDALDIKRLAKVNIAGGSIRNIALNAAFLAADESQPVQMRHLAHATRAELTKMERPSTEVDLGGWT